MVISKSDEPILQLMQDELYRFIIVKTERLTELLTSFMSKFVRAVEKHKFDEISERQYYKLSRSKLNLFWR